MHASTDFIRLDEFAKHDAVIRVYDAAGNVIETHGHAAIIFSTCNLLDVPAKRVETLTKERNDARA
jgi:hypothetical protein